MIATAYLLSTHGSFKVTKCGIKQPVSLSDNRFTVPVSCLLITGISVNKPFSFTTTLHHEVQLEL